MKNAIFILVVFMCLGCKNEEKKGLKMLTLKKKPTVLEPKENWGVTKQYDEFGNLIKYDSIYSYTYSNAQGDTVKVNLDSVMLSFKDYFSKNTPYRWNKDFFYAPKHDSLFMNNFFKENYFFNEWGRQPWNIKKMMFQMDSTRNTFLKKFHPGLMESKRKP